MGASTKKDTVLEYCNMLISAVKETVGYDLDFSIETLPVLDHYLNTAKQENLKPEIELLITSNAGVYFGEVLKRKFNGIWHIHDPNDPFTWDLMFISCPLAIKPVHITYEVLLQQENDNIDGSFRTAPTRFEILYNYLESLGNIPEEEYFSLSGRTEILMATIDLLTEIERFQSEQNQKPYPKFGKKDPLLLNLPPFDAQKYASIYGTKIKEAKQLFLKTLAGLNHEQKNDITITLNTKDPKEPNDNEDPSGGSPL